MEPPTPRTTPWLLLLCLAAATGGAVAQAEFGFVTLGCGLQGETGYVDEFTTLHFTKDAGVNGNISIKSTARRAWNTVRSFPSGTRNCYTNGLRESGSSTSSGGTYHGLNARMPILFDLYIGFYF